MNIINTRADLDAIAGTPEHDAFIHRLHGSMTIRQDIQVYPEGYGEPDYAGAPLAPVWQDTEDLTTIERYGYTKVEIETMVAELLAAQ